MQNNLPTAKQSLDMIKQALDKASEKGVFVNLETAYSISIAYNVLHDVVNIKSEVQSTGEQDGK